MRTSKRIKFPNGRGQQLAGIVDIPGGEVWAWSVFTHCFTCNKDLKAIVRISRRLAERGIGVMRYDCTGLGESEGDFSETNFSTTCLDLQAAAQHVAKSYGPVALLVGHSFGGAASMACAESIESLRGIATIAAPSDTQHLAAHIDRQNPRIEIDGEGEFSVGGQTYRLRRQLLEDLRKFDLSSRIERLTIPHIIFHSPIDRTLPLSHAQTLFKTGDGPKSFICLDGADHLLVDQPGDVHFVGDVLAIWFARCVGRYVR